MTTAPRWLPGVTAVPSSNDGGSMTGVDRYVTWHTYEAGYSLTAYDAARRLISAGNEVHLTFNPVLGGIAQILPSDRAGRGLVNLDGGVQTNRQGSVNIQIEVIAYSAHPWTKDITEAGKTDLRKILVWLDGLGVPRRYPNGDQGPLTGSGPFNRSVTGWNSAGGYFCHGQVPENIHWDHGPIKFTDIWALAAPIEQEPDVALTAAEIDAIATKAALRVWQYKNTTLTTKDAYGHLLTASANVIDTDALAAAVAAALPPSSTVSVDDLKTALRDVLGSLNDQPATP